jgi:Tfp pilus assembly protein PilV
MMCRIVLQEHPRRRTAIGRRGAMLAEVAIGTIMVLIAMTLTVKLLAYVGSQRRAAEHRQRAVQETANVLERITAYPYDEITAERARNWVLSPQAKQSLPGADLAVTIAEEHPGAGRSAKRIAVRLRWHGRSGDWESPVRVTTWVERGRPSP